MFKCPLEETTAKQIQNNKYIADTTYSAKDNMAEMKENQIQPVVPLNPVVQSEGFRYPVFVSKAFNLVGRLINEGKYRRINTKQTSS